MRFAKPSGASILKFRSQLSARSAAGYARIDALSRPLIALSSILLVGAAAPPSPDAKLRAIVAPVSAAGMKAAVEKLVSFGTRHTLSSQTDPKRGRFANGMLSLYLDPKVFDPTGFFPADRLPARSVVGVSHLPRGAQVAMDFVLCATPH